MTIATSDLVRKCYLAYETKDRTLLEGLLGDGFTFSSPLDDHISKEAYFTRCWPNSEHLKSFQIEKLFESGDEAFVTYECERIDGGKFRNTEFFRIAHGKIESVEVYFGSEAAAPSREEEIRALINASAKACRAKDVEALMACYAPDVKAYDLIKPLCYQGSTEIGKRAADWFSSFQGQIEYEVRDLEVTAGDEAAFGYSLNHLVGTAVEGQRVDMWWRATICCTKLDGRWLITHEHSSVPFDMKTAKAALDLRP